MKVKSLSRVRLLVTPWTAAHQAPRSMGIYRQEYWSGVPSPSPLNTLLHDLDNHNGVITHLEPDILERDDKWALGSIPGTKLVEAMEFQLSYFQS